MNLTRFMTVNSIVMKFDTHYISQTKINDYISDPRNIQNFLEIIQNNLI